MTRGTEENSIVVFLNAARRRRTCSSAPLRLLIVLALLPLTFGIDRGSAILELLAVAIIFGLLLQFSLALSLMPVLHFWFNPLPHGRHAS